MPVGTIVIAHKFFVDLLVLKAQMKALELANKIGQSRIKSRFLFFFAG